MQMKVKTLAPDTVSFSCVGYLQTNKPIMDQQIINLYDEYTHKPLSRQEFLKRLAVLAGGTQRP
jgi:hypothetical protein